jgi:hypothetical protein
MPRLRLFLLAAAAMLALTAAPAYAAVRPAGLAETLSTPHFVIHYSTLESNAYHIDQTVAGNLGAYAERAYNQFVSQWGYPAPADDGDGKTDIYVIDLLSSTSGHASLTLPDNDTGVTSSAFIELDYSLGLTPHAVAHAVFDAIGLGVWNATNRSFLEGAADWAAYALSGYAGFGENNTGGFDASLDCYDPSAPFIGHNCGHVANDATDNAFKYDEGEIGSARWPFFEYLSERYGVKSMLTVMQNGGASASQATSPAALLDAFLVTKGTSLSSFYDDWTLAAMTGAYSAVPLQSFAPTPYTSVLTGSLASLNVGSNPLLPPITTGAIPSSLVPVDHLGVRYVALVKGDGVSTGPCFAASLALKVTLPAGVTSKPYFQWTERNALGKLVQSAIALSVSGNVATATVPWDTCTWSGPVGYLSLANDSLSADALDFEVEGTLTIDTSTVGAGASAPPQVAMPGTTVAAPTQDVVPSIELLGPGTIHLDGTDTELRLVIGSSGPGRVQVTLGTISLGSFNLGAGTNVVHVGVSGPAEQALVAARTSGLTLTLTPLALPGGAGSSIGCTVVLDPLTSATTASTSKAHARTKAKTKRRAASKRHVVTRH